jgi:hypothetical protein
MMGHLKIPNSFRFCFYLQESDGLPRTSEKGHKGVYVKDHKDVSTIRFIPCAVWAEDANTGLIYELTAAFPMTWISKCFRYVRVPTGKWFVFDESAKQRPRLTQFHQSNFLFSQPDWFERDVSRFYYNIQCKNVLRLYQNIYEIIT